MKIQKIDYNFLIFAISTYNTDYILTKEKDYEKALHVLTKAGYEVGIRGEKDEYNR